MRPVRMIYPALLALVWILLVNDFSPGALLFGLLLGMLIQLFTRPFRLAPPRIRHLGKAAAYVALVLWDIALANVQVAYLVLFKRNRDLRPLFIAIPLELRQPEAIAVLAGTITLTPGTVSCDLSANGRSLLVHGLNVTDEAAAVRDIKQRYEARLKEIFP